MEKQKENIKELIWKAHQQASLNLEPYRTELFKVEMGKQIPKDKDVKSYIKERTGMSEEVYKNHIEKGLVFHSEDLLKENPYIKALEGLDFLFTKHSFMEVYRERQDKGWVKGFADDCLDENLNLQVSFIVFEKEGSDTLIFNVDGMDLTDISYSDIQVTDKYIKEATGNVFMSGIDTGYFAYMCALKEDVESITILVDDETMVEMFERNIIPLLGENGDKIKFVEMDLDEYVYENNPKETFDYSLINHFPNEDKAIETMDTLGRMLKGKKGEGKITFKLEESVKTELQQAIIEGLVMRYIDGISYKMAVSSVMFNHEAHHYSPTVSCLVKGIYAAYYKMNIETEADLKKALFSDELIHELMGIDVLELLNEAVEQAS